MKKMNRYLFPWITSFLIIDRNLTRSNALHGRTSRLTIRKHSNVLPLLILLLLSTMNGMAQADVTLVSADMMGIPVNGASYGPGISADGRFVAFRSSANNLVAEDTNGASDVFVKNLETNEVVLVSRNAVGVVGNGSSVNPSISSDARFVAFDSDANNLVPGDANEQRGVFVKNLKTSEIVRVSDGDNPSISADGSFVAFSSRAINLVPQDTNHSSDVFLADVVWPDSATLLLNLRHSVYSGTSAEVFWDRFTDNSDVLYEVIRNGELLGELDALSVFEDDLQRGMKYTYTVTVVDSNGTRLATDTIIFTTNTFDPGNPSAPGDLRFAVYSSTAAEIFWDRSSDDGFLQGYEITRNGQFIGIREVLSVFDDDLIPGVNYTYTVTAIDNYGNRSTTVRTSLLAGVGSDSHFPTGIRANVYSATAAELFWNRPAAYGVTYQVERNGVVVGQTSGVSYFDDSLSGGKRYQYRIIAIDLSGHRSEKFAITFLTTTDLSD